MVWIKLIKINKVSLWLILFFTVIANAQNNKHPYEKYFKWGFVGGINIFTEAKMTSEYPNANVSYQVNSTADWAIGLEYNIFLDDKWHTNIALKTQWFGDKETEFIGKNETTLPVDFLEVSWTNPDFTLSLPISMVYTYQLSPKVSINAGAGLGLTYYRYTDIVTSGIELDFLLIRESNYSSHKNPFYISGHLEAGLGFELAKTLIQTKAIYSKSFKSYRTGTYQFTNLQESPDFGGTIDQSGDYLGFSLSIHFRKKEK